MKILDYLLEDESDENTKMSSTTNSHSTSTVTSTTQTLKNYTTTTHTTTTMPTIVQNLSEYSKLIEITDDLKTYVIIITLAIICVIAIRVIKMCTIGYKLHNATIIKNHNRVSPNIP